jgi:hypothetical protein
MHSMEYNANYESENWIDWQLHFTVLWVQSFVQSEVKKRENNLQFLFINDL